MGWFFTGARRGSGERLATKGNKMHKKRELIPGVPYVLVRLLWLLHPNGFSPEHAEQAEGGFDGPHARRTPRTQRSNWSCFCHIRHKMHKREGGRVNRMGPSTIRSSIVSRHSVNALPLINNRKFPAGKTRIQRRTIRRHEQRWILELCAVNSRNLALCSSLSPATDISRRSTRTRC